MFDPSILNIKISEYFRRRFEHTDFKFSGVTIEVDQTSMRLKITYDILMSIEGKEIDNEIAEFGNYIHQILSQWFLVDYSSVDVIKNQTFEIKLFIFDDEIIEFVSYLMEIDTQKKLALLKLNGEVRPELFYKIQEFSSLID